MHQGLDNFYLIICYIKLSLIHAGSLWAGQGKGLRKRLYFWRIIIRRFYKMDYLDLEITYDQAGEMLQNSLSTGEMALEVAYSLLLCCVSAPFHGFMTQVLQNCSQPVVTSVSVIRLVSLLWSHVTANDPLLCLPRLILAASCHNYHTPRLCN